MSFHCHIFLPNIIFSIVSNVPSYSLTPANHTLTLLTYSFTQLVTNLLTHSHFHFMTYAYWLSQTCIFGMFRCATLTHISRNLSTAEWLFLISGGQDDRGPSQGTVVAGGTGRSDRHNGSLLRDKWQCQDNNIEHFKQKWLVSHIYLAHSQRGWNWRGQERNNFGFPLSSCLFLCLSWQLVYSYPFSWILVSYDPFWASHLCNF
jgi:hypothetical protein